MSHGMLRVRSDNLGTRSLVIFFLNLLIKIGDKIMGTTTFNLELTNQQVINMVKEVVFSEPEKIEILKILVGGRGYLDKKALAAEVTELIYNGL